MFRSFTDIGYLPRGRFKVIVNRYLKNSDISVKDAEDSISESIFWRVPNDYRTSMAAINQGVPLYKISAEAPITRSLTRLAQTLAFGEEEVRKKNKKGWWPFSRK
jgi:pilus assembly protein CpaE